MNATTKTRAELLAALVLERPEVCITVEWATDDYYTWDGDGPDPVTYDDPQYPHDVTVTARTIRGGKMIEGCAHLGGSYSPMDGPHCPEIHGYFPQMLDEALDELDDQLFAPGDRHSAKPTSLFRALVDLTKEIDLNKLNIRKDFSLINAHACATKAIREATIAP
jgi:hypothetical protein